MYWNRVKLMYACIYVHAVSHDYIHKLLCNMCNMAFKIMWPCAFVLVHIAVSPGMIVNSTSVFDVCVLCLRSCVWSLCLRFTYTVKMLINYVPWIILRGHPPQLLRYSAYFSSVSSLLFFVSFWFPYMVMCGHWHKSTRPCPYNSLARSKVTSPYILSLL